MVGIYKITNSYNGKIYIGQTNDIERRKNQHFTALNNGKHENERMQSDYNIYSRFFTFEVVEECPLSLLNNAEKKWIKYYCSSDPSKGYNQNKGGGNKKRKKKGRPTCLLDDLTD